MYYAHVDFCISGLCFCDNLNITINFKKMALFGHKLLQTRKTPEWGPFAESIIYQI